MTRAQELYQKNRERILARMRAYYQKNKGKINAKYRAFYREHREQEIARRMSYNIPRKLKEQKPKKEMGVNMNGERLRRLKSLRNTMILEFEALEMANPEAPRTVLMQQVATKYGCSYNTIGNYVGWARTPDKIQNRQHDAHEAIARKPTPTLARATLQALTPEQIIRDWDKIIK